MASTSSRSYSQGALDRALPDESSTFVSTYADDGDTVGTSTTEQSVVTYNQLGKEGAWQPQSMPDRSSKEEGASCRRPTSTLEKVLMAVMFAFIVANVVLVLYIVYKVKDDTNSTAGDRSAAGDKSPDKSVVVDKSRADKDTCNTLKCLQSAYQLSERIDPAVNPCEDFYQFACGKWIKNHPLTPHNPNRKRGSSVKEDLQEHLRDLLEKEDPNAIEAYKKARKFYKSCEDTDAIQSKGLNNLLESGEANLFPVLSRTWREKSLTLSEILAKVEEVGGLRTNPLISASVGVDIRRPNRSIIYFEQPKLTLPKKDYFDSGSEGNLRTLSEAFVNLTMDLGAERRNPNDGKDTIKFEKKIAGIIQSRNLYVKMTLRNLSRTYPQFDWLKYLQGRFDPEGISITMDEEVVVKHTWYYSNIFGITSRTSQRTLLNYCLWRFAYPFSKLLVIDPKEQRWKTCVKTTVKLFDPATSRMYGEKYFPPTAKHQLDEMITNLKESFKEMVQEADWMCEPTKKYALEKVDAMRELIGYPVAYSDDSVLNSKFENLRILDGEYVSNTMRIKGFAVHKQTQLLRSPVRRDIFSAAVVNAFYSPSANSIYFPAAFLYKPVYSENVIDAINYGAIGTIIGHEITHGFDNHGRDYDKEGHKREWWQEEDRQRFNKRAECLIHQFNSYVLPSINKSVNGSLTLAENIADNGGLKEGFRAYQKLIAKRGRKEAKLPVLNYTPDQIFFISCAQTLCSNLNKTRKADLLIEDRHSPVRFRVIGNMQNYKEFSRAFNCSADSYMNPAKKCRVW